MKSITIPNFYAGDIAKEAEYDIEVSVEDYVNIIRPAAEAAYAQGDFINEDFMTMRLREDGRYRFCGVNIVRSLAPGDTVYVKLQNLRSEIEALEKLEREILDFVATQNKTE